MKHSLKLILTEVGIIIASLFCVFIFKVNYNVYLLTLISLTIALYFIWKPEKRKERFHSEILLVIVISVMFYYAMTFLMGFFWGVYYTTYSKSFIGMLTNISLGLTIIFSVEIIREILIKNHAYHKSIVYIVPFVCTLLEIPSMVSFRLYTSTVDILNISLTVLLPCFVKNITLTYITYKSNKVNSLAYQILMVIPTYILPVFPNLGDFFYIIVNSLFPIIVLVLAINVTVIKYPKIENSRSLSSKDIISKAIMASMIFFILAVLYLTSNMFRFTALAIGSASMSKTINKGDIVIIDKEYKSIKENDVIAFEEQGRTIVHRVIAINEDEHSAMYQTKGDANASQDNWKISDRAIVGKVVARVRLLGWPTIKLSEMLRNNK